MVANPSTLENWEKEKKKCILDLQLFNFSIWERKLSLDAHVNKLKKKGNLLF